MLDFVAVLAVLCCLEYCERRWVRWTWMTVLLAVYVALSLVVSLPILALATMLDLLTICAAVVVASIDAVWRFVGQGVQD